MRKYVHRVGRTARAGRAGDAWTLVEEQEVRLSADMSLGRADTYMLGAVLQANAEGSWAS